MREEKVKQIMELGFEVSAEGRNGARFISMQSVPEKDTILTMLKVLTFEDEIFFWDYFHVTITDRGGYVSAYMLDENRAVYKEGNHGWSSEYVAVSVDELAELVRNNWDKDCDGGMFRNKIRVKPHYEPKRDMYLYNL